MGSKVQRGIALILFGILLCAGGSEINSTILHSLSDFPFSLSGVVIGTAGLVMAFSKDKDKKEKQHE